MTPQHLRALELANAAKQDHAAVKREIASGGLSVADALTDPRAGSLTVLAVLVAQPGWGPSRARRALAATGGRDGAWSIAEDRRVRDLTDRQRWAVVAAVKPDAAVRRAA